ncbi:MAG TPA: DUF4442 domain-containing protein [Bacteroidales bacterium]|nr:DUF4442 domain-containing protein [Bacteroidales bacterium]
MNSRVFKFFFNLWPCYFGTGGKVVYFSPDYKQAQIRIPLNLRTRNYVGTIFGGSIYGAIDPIFMLMFMKILGKGFIVWDKSAAIRFLKPGKESIYANFSISDSEIEDIKSQAQSGKSFTRTYTVQLLTKAGELIAEADKEIYFKQKIV